MKTPEVNIMNITSFPAQTIWANWQIMHNEKALHPVQAPDDLLPFLRTIANQPHKGVLEFVQINFNISNVSRAFQQQLTRHRTASYIIQSMRIVKVATFADDWNFHVPPGIDPMLYHASMKKIQDIYVSHLAAGMKQEAARGFLPLNVFSPINMSINFRNLLSLFAQRSSNDTQSEFKMVVEAMKLEIKLAYPHLFSAFIEA